MQDDDRKLLSEINVKIDKMSEKVHDIDKTLLKNTMSLDEHMRRTEVNEHKLDIFEDKIGPALDAYKFVATCFKISVGIAAIIGIYYKFRK